MIFVKKWLLRQIITLEKNDMNAKIRGWISFLHHVDNKYCMCMQNPNILAFSIVLLWGRTYVYIRLNVEFFSFWIAYDMNIFITSYHHMEPPPHKKKCVC